jgi:hypothetical protein
MRNRLFAAMLLSLLLPAAALAAEKKEKGTFVSIATLTATVIAPNGRRQVMTVQSGVDCPDLKLHAYAEMDQPRLRAAFTEVLQLYAAGLAPGAPPDPDYVARKMQEAADRVLGRPGGRFLFGGIMVN